jgi:DeoR family transcriptional regulator, L-fucose operon activator
MSELMLKQQSQILQKHNRQQRIIALLSGCDWLTTDALAETLAVSICHEMAKRERITLICSGGMLERKYRCYVNPTLVTLLKSLEIDLFIFSCEGVDEQGIMWDPVEHNAAFKAQLFRRADQSLLLIDKSKFQRSSEVMIGQISQVTQMITDAPLSRREAARGGLSEV